MWPFAAARGRALAAPLAHQVQSALGQRRVENRAGAGRVKYVRSDAEKKKKKVKKKKKKNLTRLQGTPPYGLHVSCQNTTGRRSPAIYATLSRS